MSDYRAVQEALKKGGDPSLLCDTCPWDRYCVTPPTMTSSEIDRQIEQAKAKDQAEMTAARAAGKEVPMPVGSLMTALVYAGKDTSAQVCPVFALRLRTGDGRRIADAVKAQMQGWEES